MIGRADDALAHMSEAVTWRAQNFADGTEDKCAFVPAIGKVTIAMLQRNLLRLYADGGPDAGAQPVARAAALGRRILSAPLVAGGVVLLALVAGRYAMR